VSYTQGTPDSSKPAAPEGVVPLGLVIPGGYLGMFVRTKQQHEAFIS
jgi:hypothetical protein